MVDFEIIILYLLIVQSPKHRNGNVEQEDTQDLHNIFDELCVKFITSEFQPMVLFLSFIIYFSFNSVLYYLKFIRWQPLDVNLLKENFMKCLQ